VDFNNYFYLPFIVGAICFFAVIIVRFSIWGYNLSRIDKLRIIKKFFSRITLGSVVQAFKEGLLHISIFKKNRVLGYMHMSLAFGWFLLILFGHLEAVLFNNSLNIPPQESIFFRFFVLEKPDTMLMKTFAFLMDFILLFILSGVILAYIKRFRAKVFGMKKTTNLNFFDKLALSSLWLIFPLRFLAETFTAGLYNNGSFISNSFGKLFSSAINLELVINPLWFGYSLSLGLFLIALPFSRYMHIPTEILFIFLRNYGIKLKKKINSYSRIQVCACSRCGICLDACQLNNAEIKTTQSVYVLKHIRNKSLTDEVMFNCLLCGKCQQVCPVGIEINDLRITQRIETTKQYNSEYDFLKDEVAKKTDIIYFAGCMTHLTPAIKKSMISILDYSKVNYWFLDEEKAPCCGRPLMQAGQYDAAEKLINNNQKLIIDSGAKTIVVSCPICYTVFKEDYHLANVKIKQHSEFILELIAEGKINPIKGDDKIVYHDPCELGRVNKIYDEPRQLLNNYVNLIEIKEQKEESLCCGGSLANIKIQNSERKQISDSALDVFLKYKPDYIATSCPLCKKTFSKSNKIKVHDISEIVAKNLENAV